MKEAVRIKTGVCILSAEDHTIPSRIAVVTAYIPDNSSSPTVSTQYKRRRRIRKGFALLLFILAMHRSSSSRNYNVLRCVHGWQLSSYRQSTVYISCIHQLHHKYHFLNIKLSSMSRDRAENDDNSKDFEKKKRKREQLSANDPKVRQERSVNDANIVKNKRSNSAAALVPNNSRNAIRSRNSTIQSKDSRSVPTTRSLQPPSIPQVVPSKGSKRSDGRNESRRIEVNQYENSIKPNNQRNTKVREPESIRQKSSSTTPVGPNTISPTYTRTNVDRQANTKARRPKSSVSNTNGAFTSLLPPYRISDSVNGSDNRDTNDNSEDDDLVTNGLSSWEQFLGRGTISNAPRKATVKTDDKQKMPSQPQNQYNDITLPSVETDVNHIEPVLNEFPAFLQQQQQQRLPSIQDLFPSDLASTVVPQQKVTPVQSFSSPETTIALTTESSYEYRNKGGSVLDGVLPVSDLFYRSSQAQLGDDEEHDDEELPFSAEQSDAITSDENKVRIRRNMVKQPLLPQFSLLKHTSVVAPVPNVTIAYPVIEKDSKESSRKMIRRGMEMLVGGIPIQADPPQRSVQITYDLPPQGGVGYDWASTISLNTREFGPLLHTESIAKVSDFERGLFCEFFCHAAIKWDVCPKDLKQIVTTHGAAIKLPTAAVLRDDSKNKDAPLVERAEVPKVPVSKINTRAVDDTNAEEIIPNLLNRANDVSSPESNGEIRFEIGVTREELETGVGDNDGSHIFQSVFIKAFHSILERTLNASSTRYLWENVEVDVPKLTLHETDDGYTSVCAEFRINANVTSSDEDSELRSSKITSAFSRSMDSGGFALAIAAAARDETRWPAAVRNRVVEECLFQDDDGDESTEKLHWTRTESPVMYDREVGLVIPARIGDGRSSLYKGGGTDGVFYDFSAMNVLNAPYAGEIGLRLVDAVTERSKQRQPKVIAIGDVHGCIDELRDLLRQCDFRPGDLVVFLGDLVCKGPDSIAVVQMAREIGAIGVRGNHDFEVVRWHQAIKSGVDPPVFGSEHYQIAACLSKADMNWMHSLPWYISSKDLSALFVHAGFVSGIRLAKQNPRLMMNMRSILPDGTVTSKFFNNWPWARLWDGPQTVLFGHDADRGLQQYEHAIGLDTGCVYGGRLTACILPEKKLVSVSAKREYFKYRRKHYD
jgi:Calcineurin-like phosphoesterase